MNYGKAIKVARAARGLAQKELAQRAGVDPSFLSLMERGERAPSLATVEAVSSALGMPVYLLMLLASDKQDLNGIAARDAEYLAKRLMEVLVSAERPSRQLRRKHSSRGTKR